MNKVLTQCQSAKCVYESTNNRTQLDTLLLSSVNSDIKDHRRDRRKVTLCTVYAFKLAYFVHLVGGSSKSFIHILDFPICEPFSLAFGWIVQAGMSFFFSFFF